MATNWLTRIRAFFPGVWSEREGIRYVAGREVRGWTDCVYSSYLMVLRLAGFVKFPLGVNSDKEREELERSDSRADEEGASYDNADEAIRRRYGKAMHGLPAGGLDQLLRTPGLAICIIGTSGKWPNANLRRWSPAFVGAHSIAIATLENDQSLLLDPEAPMGYAGEVIPNSAVRAFAWATPGAVRWLRIDELKETAMTPQTHRTDFPGGVRGTATIPAGATIYGYSQTRPGVVVAKYVAPPDRGSSVPVDYYLDVQWPDAPNTIPHGTFLHVVAGADGGPFLAGLLIIPRFVQLHLPPAPVGPTEEDIKKAAAEAAAAVARAAAAEADKYQV